VRYSGARFSLGARVVAVGAFWIEEQPVSVARYLDFLRYARSGGALGGGQERSWTTLLPAGPLGKSLQAALDGSGSVDAATLARPVESVSHDDAVAYAAWARLRLASDDEWVATAGWDPARKTPAAPGPGEASPIGAVGMDGSHPELVEPAVGELELGQVAVRQGPNRRRGVFPTEKVPGAMFRCVRP
jgi:formylglycine-generating enzyme required for sulfatase activity